MCQPWFLGEYFHPKLGIYEYVQLPVCVRGGGRKGERWEGGRGEVRGEGREGRDGRRGREGGKGRRRERDMRVVKEMPEGADSFTSHHDRQGMPGLLEPYRSPICHEPLLVAPCKVHVSIGAKSPPLAKSFPFSSLDISTLLLPSFAVPLQFSCSRFCFIFRFLAGRLTGWPIHLVPGREQTNKQTNKQTVLF